MALKKWIERETSVAYIHDNDTSITYRVPFLSDREISRTDKKSFSTFVVFFE